MMERVVKPELLDHLPADDSAAQRSRGDLRRLNLLMRHAPLIARELRRNPTTRRICDLGSGDGTLMLGVARRMPWRDVHLKLVDRQPVVTADTLARFSKLGWRVTVEEQEAAQAMLSTERFDAVTANLFLHHFQPEELNNLLQAVCDRCRVFVAAEPRRRRFGLLAAACTPAAGCGPVTRHDAIVSVRAGFRGQEISSSWPGDRRWILTEKAAGLFSHLFVARRS